MPILRSLPPWPNPQESIGRQIPSSRVGRRMVWWPRGPALEIFENLIHPAIEDILRVVDLGHCDLFIRLYMIGRKPENANPIIMVCCTNSRAQTTAEAAIRESGLLGEHKGFGLGGVALPLEHPAPVRRLSPQNQGENLSAASSKCDPANIPHQISSSTTTNLSLHHLSEPILGDNSSPFIIDTLSNVTEYDDNYGPLLFASSIEPLMGRRIFTVDDADQASRPYATAGVVIQAGENYYQLTVGHLFEAKSKRLDEGESQMSLDECHFDEQSDDDEQDSDYESEIMRRGSATPEDALSSSSDSTKAARDYNTEVHQDPHLVFDTQHGSGNVLANEEIPNPVETNSKSLMKPPKTGPGLPIGCLPRGKSFQAPMDYAIIAVPGEHVENIIWSINHHIESSQRVQDIAEVGHEERNIIVITHSRNIKGVLIPGKIPYRNCHAQFERLLQVNLTSEVFEGDSGSPVLDESTGSLYGHITMGVEGTNVAYINQAVDVFRDIEARIGKSVWIVSNDDNRMMKLPTSRPPIGSSPFPPRSLRDSDSDSTTSSYFSHESVTSIASVSTKAPDKHTTEITTGRLPCEFVGYSACERTFAINDVDNWIEHIISEHLQENLPKRVVCWFCNE
ncbi:hypothetical protein F4803DRAFT_178211 [Xylaria telfairii]|nr:hypothetical protein F4803DRAFT_178211 [Xylaria telfairii]